MRRERMPSSEFCWHPSASISNLYSREASGVQYIRVRITEIGAMCRNITSGASTRAASLPLHLEKLGRGRDSDTRARTSTWKSVFPTLGLATNSLWGEEFRRKRLLAMGMQKFLPTLQQRERSDLGMTPVRTSHTDVPTSCFRSTSTPLLCPVGLNEEKLERGGGLKEAQLQRQNYMIRKLMCFSGILRLQSATLVSAST